MTISKFAYLTTSIAFLASILISPSTSALSASDWQANNIISDNSFTDTDSMSVSDIQNFLNNRVPACDTNGTLPATEYGRPDITHAQYAALNGWAGPPYVCLRNYYEVPKYIPGDYIPANNFSGSIPSGAKSAAQIIYDAAKLNNISAKTILVKIATESLGPLTSDTWPVQNQYTYAMGSHCPDSGPGGTANCDRNYAGFSMQVSSGAGLMRYYLDNMNQAWWPYKRPGGGVDLVKKDSKGTSLKDLCSDRVGLQNSNCVGWNVPASCGGTVLNIQTKATAALYTYTPYQPNKSALDNMYGTGDSCSAYGNRNFWRVWNVWFGPSRFTVSGGILEQYNLAGGAAKLGYPKMNEQCGLTEGACFQDFDNGSIYWTPALNRAYTIWGGIKTKWESLGKEWSALGYPTGNEIDSGKATTQQFQNGQIHYTNQGAYSIHSEIDYAKHSYLGSPKSDTLCGSKASGCYQIFTSGFVYWSSGTGAQPVIGGMLSKWETTGKEWGSLGYPTSGEIYSSSRIVQNFEHGSLYLTKNGNHIVMTKMQYESYGHLGNPKTDTTCGTKNSGCYQQFDKGHIYQSSSTGSYTVFGGIYAKWETTGKEWGSLGYPTSNEHNENGNVVQHFEKGKITWTVQGAVVTPN